MYPVSDAFMQAIKSNTRKYYWTGTITTSDKKTYEFGNEDIVKGSGYISRQCCGNSEIELGSVYAAELGISLFCDIDRYTLDGAEIKLWFHLLLDGVILPLDPGEERRQLVIGITVLWMFQIQLGNRPDDAPGQP